MSIEWVGLPSPGPPPEQPTGGRRRVCRRIGRYVVCGCGVADASNRAKVTIVGRNPEAIWFSGYDDRVVVDEAELYSMYDIPAITAVAAE